jgi:subtilase family serine protease
MLNQSAQCRRAISSGSLKYLPMLAAMTMALAGAVAPALAQSAIRLPGNHPQRLDRYAYAGLADAARPLTMAVTLKLRNPAALDRLLAEQQDPSSPNYHRWLTPNQFAAQFGPTAADLQTAEDWLAAQGFTITSANLGRRMIAFTGTVGQASQAFNVSILKFGGGDLYGNANDPELPPQIAAVVESIQGLDNLHAASPMLSRSSALQPLAVTSDKSEANSLQLAENTDDAPPPATILPSRSAPDYFVKGLGNFVGPADFQTFYNETPLFKTGLKGSGTAGCIGIVGVSDYVAGPIAAFNQRFRLPGQPIKKILVDGSSPGINDAEVETLLDLEWAHAAAPGSPLRYYMGNSTTSPDQIDLLDAISGAVSDDACPIISISYSFCGYGSRFYSSDLHGIFQQAAAQGQTVFVAAGDDGASGLLPANGTCSPSGSRGVSEIAADPNVTAVGGSEFFPLYNPRGAVTQYSPEQVWNNGYPNGAGGGGQSGIFSKPPYQAAGTPADGARDVPDVSLIASEFDPGALVYLDKSCITSSACDGKGGSMLIPVGGTSLSSPAWAGIARIIVQAAGARLGAFNPTLYDLAASGQNGAGLHDITSGNNSYDGVAGFDAGPGYDLASGWGTANAGVFVAAYASQLPGPPTATVRPAALAFNNVVVGRTSLPKFVTITNPPRQPTWLVIGSIAGGGDFNVAQNCTGAIIRPGGSCRFAVRYAPSASGPSAPVTLQINDDAGNSPQTVALTGSGR